MFVVQWAIKGTEDWFFLARYREEDKAYARVEKLKGGSLGNAFAYRVIHEPS